MDMPLWRQPCQRGPSCAKGDPPCDCPPCVAHRKHMREAFASIPEARIMGGPAIHVAERTIADLRAQLARTEKRLAAAVALWAEYEPHRAMNDYWAEKFRAILAPEGGQP